MAQRVIPGRIGQGRARMARSILTLGGLLLAACVVQVSVLSRWRLFGVVPDLCFATVLCVAYFCGKETGAVTGIAGGFLIEAMGSQGIALLPVVYLICGYVCGYFTRAILPRRFTAFLFVLGAALPVRALTTVIYASVLWQSLNLPSLLLRTVLPELFTTAVCACAVYAPIKAVCNRPNDKNKHTY